VDSDHSNPFAVWKTMGSPQPPTPDQYKQLEAAGQLQQLASPRWEDVQHGNMTIHFELPREALSLVKLEW